MSKRVTGGDSSYPSSRKYLRHTAQRRNRLCGMKLRTVMH